MNNRKTDMCFDDTIILVSVFFFLLVFDRVVNFITKNSQNEKIELNIFNNK